MKKGEAVLLLLAMAFLLSIISCNGDEKCEKLAKIVYVKGSIHNLDELGSESRNSGNNDPVILAGSGTQADPFVTELSGMTSDIKINGSSSYSTNEFWIALGDVNLNGYKLEIKNAMLSIPGNLNGGGKVKIKHFGIVCVSGSIQNNPEITVDFDGELLTDSNCAEVLSVDSSSQVSLEDGDEVFVPCELDLPSSLMTDIDGRSFWYAKTEI